MFSVFFFCSGEPSWLASAGRPLHDVRLSHGSQQLDPHRRRTGAHRALRVHAQTPPAHRALPAVLPSHGVSSCTHKPLARIFHRTLVPGLSVTCSAQSLRCIVRLNVMTSSCFCCRQVSFRVFCCSAGSSSSSPTASLGEKHQVLRMAHPSHKHSNSGSCASNLKAPSKRGSGYSRSKSVKSKSGGRSSRCSKSSDTSVNATRSSGSSRSPERRNVSPPRSEQDPLNLPTRICTIH